MKENKGPNHTVPRNTRMPGIIDPNKARKAKLKIIRAPAAPPAPKAAPAPKVN